MPFFTFTSIEKPDLKIYLFCSCDQMPCTIINENENDLSTIIIQPKTLKRPRGRPFKKILISEPISEPNIEPMIIDQIPDPIPDSPRRRRGRPKKINILIV